MSDQQQEPTTPPPVPGDAPKRPLPRSKGPGRLLLVVALAVAAGLAFWLSGRMVQERKAQEAANATAQQNAAAPAAPGVTLPGGMRAEVSPPPAANATQPEAHTADPVVPPSFFRGLARWAVAQYQPPGTRQNASPRPMTSLSVNRLNARMGTENDIFGTGSAGGPELRRKVLTYVFQPGFVNYLGRNYTGYFIEQLRAAIAEARRDYRTASGFSAAPLRPADAAAMLRLYAGLSSDTGKILAATARHKEIPEAVSATHAASARVAQAYGRTWEGGDAKPLAGPEADALIRQAVAERAEAQAAAIRAVREQAGPLSLTDDEVFYTAEWATRRAVTPGQLGGLADSAALLKDLSGRLEQLAAEYEEQAGRPAQ